LNIYHEKEPCYNHTYAFAQKVKADQSAEEAIKQHELAENVKAEAVAAQYEAERQRVRADSLQQQLGSIL